MTSAEYSDEDTPENPREPFDSLLRTGRVNSTTNGLRERFDRPMPFRHFNRMTREESGERKREKQKGSVFQETRNFAD